MGYDIRIEQLGSCPVAVVRLRAKVHELSRVVPEACGIVWNALRAQKVAGAGRHVAIYWDDQINLEVGVEMDVPFAGNGEVVGSATPAGTVARAVHLGPYNRLFEAHEAIRAWCANLGSKLAGPHWEIYGHWMDEWNRDSSQIRTDVFYLLKTDEAPPG